MRKIFHLPEKLETALHRPIRAKLIFNPGSGQPAESLQQLASILAAMQDHYILPEVYLTRPDSPLEDVVKRAIKSGIKLIVVAGGDGTIDSVVGAMIGKDATLGIIPTGTRNNVAFNLGITGDIASCVALLRNGRRLKIDVGRVHSGHTRSWFLEGVALGLISDLYPMADEIQHGNLAQIGGLVSTLVSAAPSSLQINLDGKQHPAITAHMMLISNMAFIGPRFQVSPDVSCKDGYLHVFTFSEMTKMNMLSYAMLTLTSSPVEHNGIKHYRAKHISIVSNPPMSVIADGTSLNLGSLSVHIHPRALMVMAGETLTGQPMPSVAVENKGAPLEG